MVFIAILLIAILVYWLIGGIGLLAYWWHWFIGYWVIGLLGY